MALRSGLAAQIGIAAETTWGTYVAPDHWYDGLVSESIKLQMEYLEAKGLRASSRVLRTDRVAQNKKGIRGDLTFEVGSKSFGLWFKHILGAVATSTPTGGTATRRHLATIGDPFGLGLTVQVGRPDTAGTVEPFSYTGCKIVDWEISNAVDGWLMLKVTVDGQNETTAQSLASASYPAGLELLHFGEGVINVGGSPLATVKDISIKGTVGQKTDRYYVKGSTLKSEPIPGAMYAITGDMTADFGGLTEYNRFVNGTLVQVDATWTGVTAIEGAFFPSVAVTLNQVQFRGETPDVKGPDILDIKLPFVCLFDGTNGPISITYQTSDAAP